MPIRNEPIGKKHYHDEEWEHTVQTRQEVDQVVISQDEDLEEIVEIGVLVRAESEFYYKGKFYETLEAAETAKSEAA